MRDAAQTLPLGGAATCAGCFSCESARADGPVVRMRSTDPSRAALETSGARCSSRRRLRAVDSVLGSNARGLCLGAFESKIEEPTAPMTTFQGTRPLGPFPAPD